MKIKLILPLALALFLFSCDKGSTETEKGHDNHGVTEKHDDHDHDANHEHEHDQDDEDGLSLNDGEKWKVNESMMVHVRTAENAIGTFEAVDQNDFLKLAAELQTNINLLTSSCTMTGKAHEELHVWLLPYIALVDDLGAGTDEKEGMENFRKIQQSFQTFNEFFQ